MALQKAQLKQEKMLEAGFLLKEEKLSAPSWADNENMDPVISDYTSSFHYDYVLYPYALDSLKAQIKMCVKRSIVPSDEGKQLLDVIDEMIKESQDGAIALDGNYHSVYDAIASRIAQNAPQAAKWYNVTHSLYAQIAGDTRLLTRDAADSVDAMLAGLQSALLVQAEACVKTMYPAQAHSQLLQPSSFGHHIFAYVEIFGRARSRLEDFKERMNYSPYISGDMLGTSLGASREIVAKSLDFEGVVQNSVDAVCSRDFLMEFASILSSIAVGLSQLSQQMLTWNSTQYAYINFSSGLTSQDEVMPYRRSPIALERVRAKASKVISNMVSVYSSIQLRHLEPSAELSEMLDPVCEAIASVEDCIGVAEMFVSGMTLNRKAMKEAASKHFSTAKDLAVWIMNKTGCTPADANAKVRKIIDYAISKGSKLSLLELDEMTQFEPQIDADVYSVLIPSRAMIQRRSGGGSNPVQIRKALRHAKRKYLKKHAAA